MQSIVEIRQFHFFSVDHKAKKKTLSGLTERDFSNYVES